MQPHGWAGKNGALLGARFVANSYHVIEGLPGFDDVRHAPCLFHANVDSDFPQGLYCKGMEYSWFQAGTLRFVLIAANPVQQGFRHLAAGAVVNADKKDLLFHFRPLQGFHPIAHLPQKGVDISTPNKSPSAIQGYLSKVFCPK